MPFVIWLLLVLASSGSGSPSRLEQDLARLVPAIRAADYRGDRPALDRLEAELGRLSGSGLEEYRLYWRGFARWRRAINGFNEKPAPGDLGADLEAAVGHFRAALEKRPGWVEARLALLGCWGNQIYVAGEDAARRQAILAEAIPASKALEADGADNSRALWILGGLQLWAATNRGGDPQKAAATLRRGVEAAYREALAGVRPAWAPTWGGPENLMDLAFLYSRTAPGNRAAAIAYAEGAVTAVPEWHYVRDILLPQIEAMPDAPPPAAPAR
jgi:hypothetical protein